MDSNTAQRVAVVIEDDDDIRHLLETVLTQAGFHVVATSNGADGVEAVRDNDPVVTTLDVNMPGMDGFEVARRIRGFSQTYIVMLTALNEEIDTLQGLEAGADDYINKPFRPRELRARIEAMLRRPRTSSSAPDVAQAAPVVAPVAAPVAAPVVVAPVPVAPAPVVEAPVQPQQPVYTPPPAQQPTYAPQPEALPSYQQPIQQPQQPVAPQYEQPYQQPAAPYQAPQQQPQAPAPQYGQQQTPTPQYGQPQAPNDQQAPPPPRGRQPGQGEGWMEHNGLWLNMESRVVQQGSEEMDLTRSEFDLLAALMESNRRVRTKADLVLLLRGESYVTSHFISEADKRAIEVHMGNLRKKLGDTTGAPRWIETVRGVGYRLTAASE
jgi:two-component system, OmpR family, response regulator